MASSPNAATVRRRRAIAGLLAFGVVGGVAAVGLKLAEYRFLVVAHSLEIYVALVAALFANVGIWLGRRDDRAGARHRREQHGVHARERRADPRAPVRRA